MTLMTVIHHLIAFSIVCCVSKQVTMYWLRWHRHVKDKGAPYKIKKKRKTKRQIRRRSVVAGRQQLYCAVQSRSPRHCQTTTGKVQSSARDGTSSATVHSWQTMAGCSTHVPKPLGRHGHRVLNVWWTVLPAWLSQQNADDVDPNGDGPILSLVTR